MIRILHDDWSFGLGENRPDQSSQTFGGYAIKARNMKNKCMHFSVSKCA